ncbi:hypothetical protein GCM10009850_090450 [Nonomuraea monospora]|uniref:Transposase n=1 Tax=Nonomuraea monospora TaxID=568818 RepID=A0ABN3CVT0_9ACTN
MQLRYNYRIDPTPAQRIALGQAFGCARTVFNDALRMRNDAHENGFPSSKLCSACGAVAEAMPLQVREWTCACGVVHDRDINAAINILAAGRADRLNACGGPVRPSFGMAQPRETGSHGSAAV